MKLLTPLLLCTIAAPAMAQNPAPSNEELERRIDLLAERLDGDADLGFLQGGSFLGDRVSFGGYGEVEYTNYDGTTDGGAPSGMTDQFDLHRVVFYFGYQFNDTWSFDSEIEYEHGDEISVEFAQIDGRFSEALNFRAGHLLLPMGFINQTHEPTTFWSAQRPLIEQYILPSTWHENGVGTYGRANDFSWQVYVVNGFEASGFDLAANGLRGGRQGGSKANAEDLAVTARLDYRGVEGLLVGASVYQGNSGQASAVSDFGVSIMEAHAQYDHGPLRLRGLYAMATVDDAGSLPTPSPSDDLEGWYLEGGWNFLAERANGQALTPFVRFSNYDLSADSTASTDVDVVVVGVAYQPNPNITFKLDFQDQSNSADTTVDAIRFTIGWAF